MLHKNFRSKIKIRRKKIRVKQIQLFNKRQPVLSNVFWGHFGANK